MSTRVIKKTHSNLEVLERMLNKTTLTTQRVGHHNIVRLGNNLVSDFHDGNKEDRDRAVQDAMSNVEVRSTKEMRVAIKRIQTELNAEKKRALDKQQEYFNRMQKRIADTRDDAEQERFRELSKQKDREKEVALEEQWEECERLKEVAIQEACTALRKQLRNEFALEKEKAIADALKLAREKFKIREQEIIAETTRKCEEKARAEMEKMSKLHQQEIDMLNQRYSALERKYDAEHAFRMRIERDFKDLQDDYRRFMDYTDGKFHSDYLMRLRYLGLKLANKQIADVEYEEVTKLDSMTPYTSNM